LRPRKRPPFFSSRQLSSSSKIITDHIPQEVTLVNLKQWVFFLVLCGLPAVCPGQEKQKTAKPEPAPAAQSHSTPSPEAQANRGMSKEEVQALQADLQRMHVLVQQMQLNLAAVTSSQDPLKHQFELEIEMWQILQNQMERRVRAATGP
jgi:hypothetical protein